MYIHFSLCNFIASLGSLYALVPELVFSNLESLEWFKHRKKMSLIKNLIDLKDNLYLIGQDKMIINCSNYLFFDFPSDRIKISSLKNDEFNILPIFAVNNSNVTNIEFDIVGHSNYFVDIDNMVRWKEVLYLKLNDIILSGKIHSIRLVCKYDKIRQTFIPKKILEKQLSYFSVNKNGYYLFSTSNKSKMNRHNVYNKIKLLFSRMNLGYKKGLHIFRHHFVSMFAEKNENIVILQKIIGYSKIDAIMLYAKVGYEIAKVSILKLSEWI